MRSRFLSAMALRDSSTELPRVTHQDWTGTLQSGYMMFIYGYMLRLLSIVPLHGRSMSAASRTSSASESAMNPSSYLFISPRIFVALAQPRTAPQNLNSTNASPFARPSCAVTICTLLALICTQAAHLNLCISTFVLPQHNSPV